MNSDDQPTGVPHQNDSGGAVENANADQSQPVPAGRNPWDDDDYPDAAMSDDPDRELTMRLLRPSLISLAVCTGVIFISAVASNNAGASSPMESASLAVHRLGMFGLLISFFGILISYRLPSISRTMHSDRFRTSESALKQNRFPSGLRFLLLVNITLIVAIWLIAYSGLALLLSLLQLASLVSAGVLCSIALRHRGHLQAYAVGVLVPLVIVLLHWQMLMPAFGLYGMISQQDQWLRTSELASQLTGTLVAGLISAVICTFNAKAQATQASV